MASVLKLEHLSSARTAIDLLLRSKSSGALFSPDRAYRYLLWRSWSDAEPLVLFIGLNPSTADENANDPTIRRCIAFAKRIEARGVVVANLFAYRATKPKDLFLASEPIGTENDRWLAAAAGLAHQRVACWGTHGSFRGRAREATRLLGSLQCFGITKSGEPRHPLYLRADVQLHPYELMADASPEKQINRQSHGQAQQLG